MLGWLFKKSVEVIEPNFSDLPIGKPFRKIDSIDETTYIKTAANKYQTEPNGCRCPKWFIVTEDFRVEDAA